MKTKVTNMINKNTGKDIPNQHIIYTKDGKYLQSYNSIIVFIPNGSGFSTLIDKNKWNCSVTTGKHRNTFLGETISETRKKIASGEYVLTNLN